MGRSNTARRDQKPRLISYPATLGLVPYVKVGIDLRHSQLDVVRRSSYRDTVVLRVAVSLLSLLGDAEGTRRSWAPEHHHRSSMLQWLPPQKQKRVDWQALLWLRCHPIGLDGNGPSRIVFPVAPVFPSGRLLGTLGRERELCLIDLVVLPVGYPITTGPETTASNLT